jgi:hypothetical protein
MPRRFRDLGTRFVERGKEGVLSQDISRTAGVSHCGTIAKTCVSHERLLSPGRTLLGVRRSRMCSFKSRCPNVLVRPF